jgi:hypothetical protein
MGGGSIFGAELQSRPADRDGATRQTIRSPAKSALLADAVGRVGMGRCLGVHKALDQIGASLGIG